MFKINLKNLPAAWQSKTVVFVSDFHLGQIRMKHFAKKATQKINTLNPDLVLIGGDLYDGLKVDTEDIIEPLKDLKVKSGIYFITGNHDGFSEIATERDLEAIGKIGIIALNNQMVNIDGVQLIGVEYRHTATRQGFGEHLKKLNINPQLPSILLKHVPDDLDITEQAGISLQLSGHTHRAQAWPLSYIPKLIYKEFAYDLQQLGRLQIYTSSGVGTWGPPMRIGTNCEIVVINFV